MHPFSCLKTVGHCPRAFTWLIFRILTGDKPRHGTGPAFPFTAPLMIYRKRGVFGSFFTAISVAFSLGASGAPNPFLFVTQVPVPTEVNDNTVPNVFLGAGAGF